MENFHREIMEKTRGGSNLDQTKALFENFRVYFEPIYESKVDLTVKLIFNSLNQA